MTELEPDNSAGYGNTGAIYLREGKWNEAIAPLQKALQLQPSSSTYSNLGTAYFYLKRYPEAVKAFEQAVEMSPNDETAVGNLGDGYRWSGATEKAHATYDRAIALAYKEIQVNPRNAGALGNLALYYAKKGEPAHGLDLIRRARSIDKTDVGLMYNEALVETLAGRSPDAINSLREAFKAGYSPEEAMTDPELKDLHSRPEFLALLKESTTRQAATRK